MNFYPSFNDPNFNNFDIVLFYEEYLSDLIDDKLFSYKNMDYYECLKFIDKSLEDNPTNSILFSFKGFVLFKLDYIEDALACCDASLNMDDMIDFNWLAKAIILKNLNLENEAFLSYNEYVFIRYGENLDMSGVDFYKKPIDFDMDLDYSFKDYYSNNLDTFDELFNQNNLIFLNHNDLSLNQYKDILNRINLKSGEILKNTINKNFVDVESLDLVDKIILYVKCFVDVKTKSGGSDSGEYFLNQITFDDRMYDSAQIFTLIHELSHHLLREILQQSLMHMLNSSKNELIIYFINYILDQKEYMLMDEYCANKVQSRFMPYGYQEFDSYDDIIQNYFDFNRQKKLIYIHSLLGKSFSKDILEIIENYVDVNLREDIKNQFNLDPHENPTYKKEMEDIGELDDEKKITSLNNFIKNNFEKVMSNPSYFKKLFEGGYINE